MKIIPCLNCNNSRNHLLVTIRDHSSFDFIADDHNVVLCKNCGLGYLNPQQDDSIYKKYYQSYNRSNVISASIDNILKLYRYRKILARYLYEKLSLLENINEFKLLDVGSGIGALMYYLSEYDWIVEGLEISDNDLRYSIEQLGLKTHHGWIFDHDLKYQNYDILVNTAVIEHFTNPLDALKEMNLLLRDGGYIYINTQDLFGMVLRNGINSWFKFVHTYYYTLKTLSSLLIKAGFEIVSTWQMPPIIKYSNFLNSRNFCSGELNIIGKKINNFNPSCTTPILDNYQLIIRAFEQAKKRDLIYYYSARLLNNRITHPITKVVEQYFIKEKYIFDDYDFNVNEWKKSSSIGWN